MLEKRNLFVLKIIFLSFLCFIVRFFYIQVLNGERLAKAATAQRVASADIDKPRGDILDRNDIPLTSRNRKSTIVLKPLFLRDQLEAVEKVCKLLTLDYSKVRREIEVKKEPLLYETDEEKKNAVLRLNIQGISAINSLDRYSKDTLAKHVLGYLNRIDMVGEAGMEKFYEKELSVDRESTVAVVTDARNNLLQGLGYRIIPGSDRKQKNNVKLTIDYHIQKVVEEVMDRNKITGAVVIEDIKNGDILAIASKPDFDQYDVGHYLNSDKNELFNRAVASYNLGSIFKIIDAAAIFESGAPVLESHYCTGLIRVGDKEYRCSNGVGHGEVNFMQAFAQSCNTYFIKSGIKLGNKSILEMAKRFGLGASTGLGAQGVSESSGIIPEKKYYTDGDIANISIGQGDIMATPLQVANIAATIANGGIINKVNIVDSIVDEQGDRIKSLRVLDGQRIIPRNTANKIKGMMDEVTISGSAKKARLEEYGGAGGKTGSAETGQYIRGEKVVQAWFAGYFPREYPKYAVAVFIENGKSGGEAAVPIFAEIVEALVNLGY